METGRDCLSLHNPLAAMTPSRGQGSEAAAGLYQGTSQLAGQHGALNPQPGSSMAHIKVALPSLLAGRLLNKHSCPVNERDVFIAKRFRPCCKCQECHEVIASFVSCNSGQQVERENKICFVLFGNTSGEKQIFFPEM